MDDINFEKEFKELEEITNKMESKSLSLDESLALYKKGIEVTKKLEKALKQAENKVQEVIEVNE